MDGENIGLLLSGAVKDFFVRQLAPVRAAIAEINQRFADQAAVEALVKSIVRTEVSQTFATLPAPSDGEKGERGDPGRDGRDGKDGKDGLDGTNGINGRDGKDGRDSLQVEDFSAELGEDGRTLTLKLMSGGKEFKSQIKLAIPLDRGVFKAAENYERGDTVSWDGSIWIAQKMTKEKPGTPNEWRLAVKRGRDGKDAGDTLHPPKKDVVRLK